MQEKIEKLQLKLNEFSEILYLGISNLWTINLEDKKSFDLLF